MDRLLKAQSRRMQRKFVGVGIIFGFINFCDIKKNPQNFEVFV